VQRKDEFVVHDTELFFTKDNLKDELKNHPETLALT